MFKLIDCCLWREDFHVCKQLFRVHLGECKAYRSTVWHSKHTGSGLCMPDLSRQLRKGVRQPLEWTSELRVSVPHLVGTIVR